MSYKYHLTEILEFKLDAETCQMGFNDTDLKHVEGYHVQIQPWVSSDGYYIPACIYVE